MNLKVKELYFKWRDRALVAEHAVNRLNRQVVRLKMKVEYLERIRPSKITYGRMMSYMQHANLKSKGVKKKWKTLR